MPWRVASKFELSSSCFLPFGGTDCSFSRVLLNLLHETEWMPWPERGPDVEI